MYYTDDSILPEYMAAADHHGRAVRSTMAAGDADIPVTWDEQVQTAVDCLQRRRHRAACPCAEPRDRKGLDRLRSVQLLPRAAQKAVPKMILQVGGSISFSPKTDEAKAKWLDYDTRHMLTELDPKPEFVTVAIGTRSGTSSR